MNGLEAWAATFPATCIVAGCTLVLGLLTGWLAGTAPRRPGRRERRRLMDLAEDRAYARWLRAVRRELPQAAPELHHERRTSTAAFLDPEALARNRERTMVEVEYRPEPIPGVGTPIWAPRPRTDEEVAHEAWLAHCDLAVDLANDDPTVSAWTEDAAARMDAFLARLLGEHPVPWPDGGDQ